MNIQLKVHITLRHYYFADGTADGYHYYIRGHQGNNRIVANYQGTIEQTTHYYLYRGILSQSTNQGVQKFKYVLQTHQVNHLYCINIHEMHNYA